MKIIILMATYNGEKYIRRQLESLMAQTYTNWELLIRDDGSTDDTVKIIEGYVRSYDHISLIINTTHQKGVCINFSSLFASALSNKKAGYIMFCDQDDIWKPEKIEQSMLAMQQKEKQCKSEPVLIYCDLELMDDEENTMPVSLKLKHHIELRNLISFNYVYGCTMLMNRAMMEKIGHIPYDAENHDYWVALVASIYRSNFINQKLIRYRQHSNNASDNGPGNNSLPARIKRHVLMPEKEISSLQKRLHMLTEFFKAYRDELSDDNRRMLQQYLEAYKTSRFKVGYVILANRMFKRGLFQSVASLYQVLFFYNRIRAKVTSDK